MRRMLMIVGALASLCFITGTSSAVEYKWTDAGFVEVGRPPAPSIAVKRAVVVPPGHHAHTRADGSTFIHGDENYGDPAAHAGVARPWPKTGFPGQTVIVDEVVSNAPASILAADPCPGGVCPPRGRRTVSGDVVTVSAGSSYYSETSSSRRGVLGRIVDNIRSRRAARGGGFFGCPCR